MIKNLTKKNIRKNRKITQKNSIQNYVLLGILVSSIVLYSSNLFTDDVNSRLKTLSNGEYTFMSVETGGGGDCLFSSIAAGLNETDIQIPGGNIAQEVRNIVANEILNWTDDEYKEKLDNIFIPMKDSKEWYDHWDPRKIKNKQELANQFKTMGNNHWGTDFDIGIISRSLNIGFIILQNNNNKIFYQGITNPKNPQYYILLYYLGNHYQLGCLLKKGEKKYMSAFTPKELPCFLPK